MVDVPDPKGAQRRSFLRAVPALEENHSVSISLAKNDRLNAQTLDLGAKLVELCQNPLLIKSVHLAFPNFQGRCL